MINFIIIVKKIFGILRSYIFITSLGKFKLDGFRIGSGFSVSNIKAIKIGQKVHIGKDSVINCFEDDGDIHLCLGSNVYIGRGLQLNAYKNVMIESNVVMADRVYISDATHNSEDLRIPIINQGTSFQAPVLIKEGSWIGINCVILPGVTIGKNAIVAANSVVTKDVPDFSVVSGVPANVIKIDKH